MPPDKRIFGLKKNAFFLGLVSLFNDFSNEMIQSIMPYFLAVTLGVSKFEIGLIEGAANTMSSFLRIFSGWLSDKMGKRKTPALLGYTLSVLTRPFFIFVSSFTQIISLRVIDRIGKGFRDSPRDALLASSVEGKELGKSFGYQRAMDAIGGLFGPLGAFLALKYFLGGTNYSGLFILAFAIGILAILSFIFIREVPGPRQSASLKLDIDLLRKNNNFALFVSSVFIFGLGTIPAVLMFVRPVELGFHLVTIPIVYFIYSGTNALMAIPLGKLSDRIGERLVIAGGFVLAITAAFILACTESIPLAILAFVLMGVYAAATDGIERALASKLIDPKLLATGEGILQAAVGISSFLSAVIGGLLWDGHGYSWAFAYWGIASIAGFLVFCIVSMNGRHHKVAEKLNVL